MIPVNEDLIVNAVQNVSKAVVNIASVRLIQDQLYRVFPAEGVGSGVIIDERCHVLTNNHVVEGAQRLKITLTDGRVFNGIVKGTDEATDLAVVKLDSTETLPFATLGNSDNLKIGQIVIAIGNPFGLTGGPTVTAGIISSLNRKIQFDKGVLELIQTDAAINPGNSGGPLVDTNGQVIAINTAKMPYAHGIGFAVPINIAKSVVNDLIQNGRVINRPWIGISYVKITRQLAQYYRLPSTEGVLIANVEPRSPADYAGLRKGDIIEAVDGRRIDDTVEISLNLRKKKIADIIIMSVNRYGQRFEVSVQPQNTP
ncbi:MAG: trypsin-like peptidase domain-containing protein [Thermoproteota archaeon]|jgi:S1-C subfamily serine protease|nr:trypsin-like peptidase domain-containing protein [Thermoproteota archaeon]HYY50430.1 trypsin-like peptidase domain-containing protein [Nitrososphaeraceae archaeon]